jgi:hypothetical protein
MTNVRSASNAWGSIKKKLFNDTPPANIGSTTPTSAKKRKALPTGKAKSGEDNDDNDEDQLVGESPTKKRGANTKAKPKTTKTEKKSVKTEESKTFKDEEDSKTTVKDE